MPNSFTRVLRGYLHDAKAEGVWELRFSLMQDGDILCEAVSGKGTVVGDFPCDDAETAVEMAMEDAKRCIADSAEDRACMEREARRAP